MTFNILPYDIFSPRVGEIYVLVYPKTSILWDILSVLS